MKRFLSILFALLTLILCLSSCGQREKIAFTVSGADISEGIYAYYYDCVSSRPQDYGLDKKSKEKDFKKTAREECVRFVALNTYFNSLGISLSPSEKVSISEKVNNYWRRFQAHYEKIGTKKHELNKVFTCEEYENKIFNALYDKGTGDKQSEEKIKMYFYSEYTAFRCICAYFTTADGKNQITESEKRELLAKIKRIEESSGKSVEDFNEYCQAAGYTASNVVILNRNSPGYPLGFFTNVYNLRDEQVKIISYDDSVFAVRKENLEKLSEQVYMTYRSACIRELYGKDWEEHMTDYISNFKIE